MTTILIENRLPGVLPAHDAAACEVCGLEKRDIMISLDPRVADGLAEMCGGCYRVLYRARALRAELEDLAKRWATGRDDRGMAARLLQATGRPSHTAWALFKQLVAEVRANEPARAGQALRELTGVAR